MFQFGLHFDEGILVSTSIGTRIQREAIPTAAFWEAWRNAKEGLQAKGYGVRKMADGVWKVLHWEAPSMAPPEAKSTDFETPRRPVRNVRGLLPHQPECVGIHARALEAYRASLDASDTGTGKSFTGMATFREIGIKPLVVCTKNTLHEWPRTARHLGMDVLDVVTWDKVKLGRTPYATWRNSKFIWNTSKVSGLLMDEVHRASGASTQTSAMVVAAKDQSVPTLVMSASAADSPMQMRAVGYLLGLHNDKDFPEWMMAHGCYLDNWERWRFGGTQEDLLRIHRAIFPARGARVRIADIPGFPKTQVTAQLVGVEDPDRIEKAHQELKRLIERVRTEKLTEEERSQHLTAMLRAQQLTELQKVPAVVEQVGDWMASGMSVVVGCSYEDTVRMLAGSFGKVKVATLTGSMSDKARQKVVDDFAADRVRIVVMNAAIEGVNLQDVRGVHPRGSILLPNFRPLVLRQFLGRVHRATGRSPSLQRVLFAGGCPVEERKAERLTERLRGMSILNDGVDVPITEEDMMGLF